MIATNTITRAAQRNATFLFLFIITLLGAILRFIAAKRPFGTDELVTLRFAVSDWSSFWMHVPYDHTPPLYYFFSWLAQRFFPISETFSRLPGLFFSIATIPLVYWAFRQKNQKMAACMAAGFFAFSSSMVEEGSANRAYGLLAFVAVGFLGFVFRWAKNRRSRDAVLAAIFAFFGGLTHATFFFVILAVVVAMLGTRSVRRSWRMILMWCIVAGAPFLVWSAFAISSHEGFTLQTTWFSQLGFSKGASLYTWGAPGFSWSLPTTDQLIAVSLSVMLLWLVQAARFFKHNKPDERFSLFVLGFMMAILIITPLATNVITARYYTVCYISLFFLLGIGAASLRPKWVAVLCVIAFLAVPLKQQSIFLAGKTHLQRSIEFFQEKMTQGDLLVVAPFGNALVWRYYLPEDLRVEGLLPYRYQTQDPFADTLRYMARIIITDESVKDLSILLHGEQRVWFLGESEHRSNANRSPLVRDWFLENDWEQHPISEAGLTRYERRSPIRVQQKPDYHPGQWIADYLAPIQAQRSDK